MPSKNMLCAEAAKSPRKTDLESWLIPSKPWERVHIDYAGPINGYYYFLLIDAYSKWSEIYRTRSTNTTKTLEMLDEIFSRFGNPKILVSDNGSQFVSARFKPFCDEAGITHLTIAPYHPQSNGQAERFVDTLKRGLKKLREGGNPATFRHLQTFFSVYRSTPNRSARDHKSPAELFLGRPLTTTLNLLKPRKSSTPAVNSKQNNQFNQRHGTVKREFSADDLVYAEVHHHNQTSWVLGKRHLESISEATESNLPWTVLLEGFGMQNLCTPCSDETADHDSKETQQPPEMLPEVAHPIQQLPEVLHPAEPTLDQEKVLAPEVVVEGINPQCSNQPIRNRRLPAWLGSYDLF
ncbi:uncharacterized protein K02A2.6-like [Wyeomyia smithii]|uniref:uncharacterized protein K02A2.6-like n=1 Tax=Wyeomyia smithii TaxID=174621 RepID=UPI00246816DF|nr:uncharacterized protein K02A2.6-like [Wyeomyia smithii]